MTDTREHQAPGPAVARVAVATIAAKRHLSLVRVLAESFRQHHPDVPFFVLLADEPADLVHPATEPFEVVPITDVGMPALERVRFQYSQQELTYALTPYLLRHLLDRGFTGAAYLKQESLVTGDMCPVLDLLGHRSIVLTPHLLTPLDGPDADARELNILQSGVYNVGFLGVSATPTGRAFLAWWEDRLLDHCRRLIAQGLHFEQRWLDLVPSYFEDVAVVRDPGFNVGHWNLPDRRVTPDGDGFLVDGHPCRFVRFSGFDREHPTEVTRYNTRLTIANVGPAAALFARYVTLLDQAGFRQTSAWPYAWDTFDDGTPIPDRAREWYRALGDEAARFGDPRDTRSPDSFLAWYRRKRRAEVLAGLRPRALVRRLVLGLKRIYWRLSSA